MPKTPVCRRPLVLLLALPVALVSPAAAQGPGAPAAQPAGLARLVDAPLAATRRALLESAFAAVSAMPADPHHKNRARGQQGVVVACLQLGQEELARTFIARIDGWRAGVCWADLALHAIERGDAAAAEPLLSEALRIAAAAAADPQEWRADRVRARVAEARLRLGDETAARAGGAGVGPGELAGLEAALARRADAAAFAGQLADYDRVLATGSFDQVDAVLRACGALFDRDYADAARRAEAEHRVVHGHPQLPVALRLEHLAALAETALRHGDLGTAGRLVDAAHAARNGARWLPEDEIAWRGRLAALRARAGDVRRAADEAAASLALFHERRAAIADVFRAAPLRQLAVAMLLAAGPARAADVFALAVEEGAANPNARPRAEDLAATCTAMAVHGCVPDERLRRRIAQVQQGLGDPW